MCYAVDDKSDSLYTEQNVVREKDLIYHTHVGAFLLIFCNRQTNIISRKTALHQLFVLCYFFSFHSFYIKKYIFVSYKAQAINFLLLRSCLEAQTTVTTHTRSEFNT